MPHRRTVLKGALAATAAAAASPFATATAAEPPHARVGRVKQSVAFWCFNARGDKWGVDKVCEVTKGLGVGSVELIGPEHWPTLAKHGLICAMAPNGMPGAPYVTGLNNTRHHDEVVGRTRKAMEQCADAKFPNVIAFVGYKFNKPDDPKSGEIERDVAVANCVTGLKRLAGEAEKRGVTVCLEHLNSRDTTDPMKGHPGYQGDDLDLCAEILRKVGSPRVKLLFDIYHVQVMHGDVIRRIEQTKDLIGHVHTAGCPGRGELDDNQELHYPAVLRKLLQVGYAGYVGQEFIPTRDPLAGLTEAVKVCDV